MYSCPLAPSESPSNLFTQSTDPTKNPKNLHYNVYGQLTSAWLEEVNAAHCAKKDKSPSSPRLFDHEKKLIEELFGPKVQMATEGQNQAKEKIYDFCQKLRKDGNHHIREAVSKNKGTSLIEKSVHKEIAMILFLAERDLKKTASLITNESLREIKKHISSYFNSEIHQILKELDKVKSQHDLLPIQSSSMAVCARRPLEIAKMLVTSSEMLNLGLIEPIIKAFYPQGASKEEDKELIQTLRDILHLEILQDKIAKLVKPSSDNLISNDLIRITLNLPPSTPVSNTDTKIAALATLLSHMRQGDVGSCFGTIVSIMMMGTLKSKVLSDLSMLLTEGKINRPSKTDQTDFVPVLDIGDDNLRAKILINRNGRSVNHKKAFLWDHPGFKAAACQLGISNLEREVRFVVEEHFKEKSIEENKPAEITPEQLIKKLVNLNNALTREERRDLKNKALFAFSAQNYNPLLKSWESCIAAMAEATSDGNVRKGIVSCVLQTLKPHLPAEQYALTNWFFGENKAKDVLSTTLNSGIQIRYDERAKVETEKAMDGHSTEVGAFVMHKLKAGRSSVSAKLVKTPEEFTKFVLNVLKTASVKLGTDKQSQDSIEKVRMYMKEPEEKADSFINQAIKNYNLPYGGLKGLDNVEDPHRIWKKISHLPFRDARGNDPVPVLEKAIGIQDVMPEPVTPKNARELLESFISFGRRHKGSQGKILDRDLVCNGIHAFSLIPNNSTALPAINSDLDPETWVAQNVIKPGKEIAEAKMTREMKNKFVDALLLSWVPKELAGIFKADANKIYNEKESTVSSYSTSLLNVFIKTMDNKEKNGIYTRVIMNTLYEKVLSQEDKNRLLSASVKIADSNWIDERADMNIYFMCFYNPISQEVDMCSIDENNQRFSMLNQNEYVNYVPWTMYGVEVSPALDDKDMVIINA